MTVENSYQMAFGVGEILKGLRFTKNIDILQGIYLYRTFMYWNWIHFCLPWERYRTFYYLHLSQELKKLNIKIVYIFWTGQINISLLCFFNCPTSFRVPFIFFLKIFCTLKKQVIFFLQHAESLVSSVLTSLHETVEGKGIQNLSINKIVVVKIKWHVLHSISYFKILTTCLILLLN